MGFILAALYAGKNPAIAPANTNKTKVVMATLKSTSGFRKYSLFTCGPTNSSNDKLASKPTNPEIEVINIDSCNIIPMIDKGEAPSAFLIPISFERFSDWAVLKFIKLMAASMIVKMPIRLKMSILSYAILIDRC